MGQDIFVFSINNCRGITNRLKLSNATSTLDYASTEDLTKYYINLSPECRRLLERNGWKFPKNYPIKF